MYTHQSRSLLPKSSLHSQLRLRASRHKFQGVAYSLFKQFYSQADPARVRENGKRWPKSQALVPAARSQSFQSNLAAARAKQQQVNPSQADDGSFFAEATFESLGFSAEICRALDLAGLKQPSSVQALASSPLLEGKSVVLAAETGSGKTLAYLLPIIQKICHNTLSGRSGKDEGALILCPNTALCNQVVSVVSSLKREDGSALVKAVRIASSIPPPAEIPQIVVSTPAGLISAAREYKHIQGSGWSQEAIISRARWVVVDEADLLLTGGYARDTKKILQSMRLASRGAKIDSICNSLGMTPEEFQAFPRLVRMEALAGKMGAITDFQNAQRQAALKEQKEGEAALAWDPTSEFQTLDNASLAESRDPSSSLIDTAGQVDKSSQTATALSDEEAAAVGRSSASVAGDTASEEADDYWERQHVFVAATMPQESKKAVGTDIQKICPDAVWLSGRQLHQSVQTVNHVFQQVTDETWARHLQEAIQRSAKGKTLVFTGTVNAAEKTAAVLRRAGTEPLVYHREIAQAERDLVLNEVSARHDVVIVCTDAAARGLDLPEITHVIQADFAASAIDFLHRAGRTGRAGKSGKVTSLYDGASKVLAEAIQDAIESGDAIDGAFSRNRSFRNKVRKYGKYVPAGQRGPRAVANAG